MSEYAEFQTDLKSGFSGERIFEEKVLKPMNKKGYEYKDVSDEPFYRKRDIDFIWTNVKNGTFEVKNSYRDDDFLYIEELGNCDETLAPLSKGWWYYTQAKFLAFVSKDTGTIVLLQMDDTTKFIYEMAKERYELRKNKVSINRNQSCNNKWQGAYRRIPLSLFNGKYKIIK